MNVLNIIKLKKSAFCILVCNETTIELNNYRLSAEMKIAYPDLRLFTLSEKNRLLWKTKIEKFCSHYLQLYLLTYMYVPKHIHKKNREKYMSVFSRII